ncbi:hypothetical protein [Streptomyces sp. NPDC088789]|uniref:hypothetical protein n=1 Tax=Streptomyces sp. NPDC088789 TaxID=3365899 RepID=UPI00382CA4C4
MVGHTVNCAYDDCSEYSLRMPFHPTPPEKVAADHRRSLARDGWGDVEGRDYCPDHKPSQEGELS